MSIGTSFMMAATVLATQGSLAPDRATLLQISLAIPQTGAAKYEKAMEEETAKITSCAGALKIVDRIKERVGHGSLSFTVKTDVALTELPAPLRDALISRPIGRATPIFGGDKAFRVLIRCEPTFVVPPSASQPGGSTVSTT